MCAVQLARTSALQMANILIFVVSG